MIRTIYFTPINVERWQKLSYWLMKKPPENYDSCSLHLFICICTRYVKWVFYLEIMGITIPWFYPYIDKFQVLFSFVFRMDTFPCNNGYWKYIEILCMRKTLPYWIIHRNQVPYHKGRYAWSLNTNRIQISASEICSSLNDWLSLHRQVKNVIEYTLLGNKYVMWLLCYIPKTNNCGNDHDIKNALLRIFRKMVSFLDIDSFT